MKIRKLTAFALALASLAGTAPVTGLVTPQTSVIAAETKFEKTGKCGENVTYELSDDGTLTVSGTGPMYNYERPSVNISISGENIDGKLITDGTSPFMGQSDIKKVVIEEGVTTVGAATFLYCVGLQEVKLPSTVQAIYDRAFVSAPITELDIPAGTKIFAPTALDCCVLLENVNVDEKNENYRSIGGVVFSKDMKQLICYPFGKQDEVYQVPTGVETICSCAFGSTLPVKDGDNYYGPLKELYLPSSLKTIEEDGLNNMMNLEKLTFPEGMESVSLSGLRECKGLKEVTFLNPYCQLTGISFFSSDYNFKVKSYDVSYAHEFAAEEGLEFESLGSYNGTNTQPLPEIKEGTEEVKCGDDVTCYVLDDTLVFKGSGPMYDFKSSDEQPFIDQFFDCPKRMIFDEGITYIGSYVGYDCSKLEYVYLPSTLTGLGEYAFYDSSSIIGFELPKGFTKLGTNALADCAGLTAIHVAPENKNFKSVDGVLFDKSGKTLLRFPVRKCDKYDIPEGTEIIADYAFYNNMQRFKDADGSSEDMKQYGEVKEITIPDSVVSIGDGAFKGLEMLENIVIPDKVTHIGKGAFSNDSGLVSITIPASVTELDAEMFSGCSALKEICGYKGSAAETFAKDNGYTFKELKGGSTEPTKPVSNKVGDANLDGDVTLSDALVILQYVANGSKYKLEGQALANADCCDTGDGVTAMDALSIQRLDAKIIKSLPDSTATDKK